MECFKVIKSIGSHRRAHNLWDERSVCECGDVICLWPTVVGQGKACATQARVWVPECLRQRAGWTRPHIGVIIINDDICASAGHTLELKLLAGRIFEHSDPQMERSRDAVGRSPNTSFLRKVEGLEFVGYTDRSGPDLDNLYA